ncbi:MULTISPECIES: hypothetical protein [unclassified Burkholderia]|uniref:hypothetical protein n=1 Tax=Burkholderia sp. LMG 13014 TaxID=2709306 RepID=UPI001641BF89|nr:MULTISPECIES: hypothetical protein [unclassified Burkholderia]
MPLTGQPLDTLMNRLEADLEESDSSRESDLAARLRAQPLRADSLDAIARLHTLWMHAGDPAAARAVLDDDGAGVHDAAAPDARPDIRMQLALYRLQVARHLGENDAVTHAIGEMHDVVRTSPTLDADRFVRARILDTLEYDHAEHALDAIDLRHALNGALADRATFRAWDDANRQCLRAWALPPRREAEVRLARLAARAAHAQGDLDGALARCEMASHSLESDGSDDFIEYELPWLLEAGRFDDAGRRAFFHVYQIESSMLDRVGQIIHARLAEPTDTSVWWPLCAMRAAGFAPTLERLVELGAEQPDALAARSPTHGEIFAALGSLEGDALRYAVADAAREVALRRAPGHPWIARLAAVYDGETGRIDATTQAARLLAAAQEGEMHDNRTAFVLTEARIRALGVATALKLPPPSLRSGLWSYAFSGWIEDRVEEAIEALPAAERAPVRADLLRLRIAAYEQGRACMERFFETGKGHPYDACAHLYSMLCNNLAILYRDEDRYDEALVLHRSGIAASSFAEHYSGVRYVLACQDKDAEMLEAAEQLWHYAAEFGFSRHDPNWYVRDVVRALYRLDRCNELPIWLERLVGWQREHDQVDGSLPDEALIARFVFVSHMAASHPDQASALYDAARGQADASRDLDVLIRAGDAAYDLGRQQDVKNFYERVLAGNRHAAEPLDLMEDVIERRIREADAPAAPDPTTAAPNKRWWKFWQ